jgi:hypothetical protein
MHDLVGIKRPAIGKFIRGQSEDPNNAINSASAEWAALQNTSGRGTYDNQGTNHARITAEQVKAALIKAKTKYAELIKSGVADKKAYGMAIGAYADASGSTPTDSPKTTAEPSLSKSGTTTPVDNKAPATSTTAPLKTPTPASVTAPPVQSVPTATPPTETV